MSIEITDAGERVPVSTLRPHPEHALLFGDPDESFGFEDLCTSIKKLGQLEPIIAKRDGVVLSGHRRLAALTEIGTKTALVRWATCETERDELELLIRLDVDRKPVLGHALKRLGKRPKAPRKVVPAANVARPGFDDDAAALASLYVALDRLLTKRPLKHETGTAVHHRWTGLIRDVGVRAWREIETVVGDTSAGRQLSLISEAKT